MHNPLGAGRVRREDGVDERERNGETVIEVDKPALLSTCRLRRRARTQQTLRRLPPRTPLY